jgi:hypothetical protein
MRPICPGNPLERYSSRREFLYVGLLGGLGLTLPQYLRGQALAAASPQSGRAAVAQGIIQIFLPGGLAHQESFDPKPLRPRRIPRAIRSHRHPDFRHPVRGLHEGNREDRRQGHGHPFDVPRRGRPRAGHPQHVHRLPALTRLEYPSIGSVISHELGTRNDLPPYVCVPSVPNEYANSGYLSSAFGPFALGSDPAQANFQVRDLNLPKGRGRGPLQPQEIPA